MRVVSNLVHRLSPLLESGAGSVHIRPVTMFNHGVLRALPVFLLTTQVLAVSCPPLTPPLPVVGPLSGRPAIAEAAEALRSSLEAQNLDDTNTTSFSIDFYSLADESSVFTYHFSAPILANSSEGVQEVDSNSIYRIGSISKVFTVYAYLASVGDISWNHPITRYVPELAKNAKATAEDSDLDVFRWDEITLGSLAAQLSGMPRQTAPDGEADQSLTSILGLPEVPPVPGRYCKGTELALFPCDRESFFKNLFAQHPVVPAESSPVYSNIAYLLLAYAVENMTGTLFPQVMNESLLAPLSMDSTYYPLAPESLENAVIPFNETLAWFTVNIRSLNPGGAHYSTTNDMRLFGKSILNSTLLPPAMTRRWLKPHSFQPDSYEVVGAPWEIVSYPPGSRFPTRVYSKAGDIGLYSAQMGLIPDYNVGFTVLAAGPRASQINRNLSDAIVDHFIPALKQVAVTQAWETYAGTYSSDDGVNNNLVLSVPDAPPGDESGPTLQLDQLIWNGTDIVQIYTQAFRLNTSTQELQTDLHYAGFRQRISGGRVKESWRVGFNVVELIDDVPANTTQSGGVYQQTCAGWASLDALKYGGISFDEVVFTRDGADIVAVDLRFLQQEPWAKVEDGSTERVKRAEKVKMVNLKREVYWR
jgi:CubicO group peptidase (beta-lactamase class C family)